MSGEPEKATNEGKARRKIPVSRTTVTGVATPFQTHNSTHKAHAVARVQKPAQVKANLQAQVAPYAPYAQPYPYVASVPLGHKVMRHATTQVRYTEKKYGDVFQEHLEDMKKRGSEPPALTKSTNKLIDAAHRSIELVPELYVSTAYMERLEQPMGKIWARNGKIDNYCALIQAGERPSPPLLPSVLAIPNDCSSNDCASAHLFPTIDNSHANHANDSTPHATIVNCPRVKEPSVRDINHGQSGSLEFNSGFDGGNGGDSSIDGETRSSQVR